MLSITGGNKRILILILRNNFHTLLKSILKYFLTVGNRIIWLWTLGTYIHWFLFVCFRLRLLFSSIKYINRQTNSSLKTTMCHIPCNQQMRSIIYFNCCIHFFAAVSSAWTITVRITGCLSRSSRACAIELPVTAATRATGTI